MGWCRRPLCGGTCQDHQRHRWRSRSAATISASASQFGLPPALDVAFEPAYAQRRRNVANRAFNRRWATAAPGRFRIPPGCPMSLGLWRALSRRPGSINFGAGRWLSPKCVQRRARRETWPVASVQVTTDAPKPLPGRAARFCTCLPATPAGTCPLFHRLALARAMVVLGDWINHQSAAVTAPSQDQVDAPTHHRRFTRPLRKPVTHPG